MQTWLDWDVSGSSFSYRRAYERLPGMMAGVNPETYCNAMTDDAFALRISVETSALVLANAADGAFTPPLDAAMENAVWRESLAPFFTDTGKAPLAVALDRGVIRELGDARVSENVRDYARAALERYGAMCAGRAMVLAAVVLMRRGRSGRSMVSAAFCRRKSSEVMQAPSPRGVDFSPYLT